MNIERAADWLKRTIGRRVAVIHHDDGDGLSSGAQLIRWLERGAADVFHLTTLHSARLSDERRKRVVSWGPAMVVTADFAGGLDAMAHAFAAEGVRDLLILDHHQPRLGALPDGTLFVNPRLDGQSMPAAALVFDVLRQVDAAWAEEADWIAALGVITDMGATDRPDILESVSRRYPDLVPPAALDQLDDFQALVATPLGRLARAVDAAATVEGDEGVTRAVRLLVDTDHPARLLSGEDAAARALFEGLARVEQEVARWTGVFDGEVRSFGAVRFLMTDAPFAVASPVANRVSLRRRGDVVVIGERRGEGLHLSLRCQDGWVNLDAAIRRATERLGAGGGGGHPVAAGATVPLERGERFLTILAEEIGSREEGR